MQKILNENREIRNNMVKIYEWKCKSLQDEYLYYLFYNFLCNFQESGELELTSGESENGQDT